MDKDSRYGERILVVLKELDQGGHEPLLIICVGVIVDVASFAAALYLRNTPYMMMCTSIASGIDAGPSPRICRNGFDLEHLYGAYHPNVQTITDRGFWKILHLGWLGHGVAETVKMAVMKDLLLVELLEECGVKCDGTLNFDGVFMSITSLVPTFSVMDFCKMIYTKAGRELKMQRRIEETINAVREGQGEEAKFC